MAVSPRNRAAAAVAMIVVLLADLTTKAWAAGHEAGLEGIRLFATSGVGAGVATGWHLNTANVIGLALSPGLYVLWGVALVLAGLGYLVRSRDPWTVWAGAMITAGALGNTADRMVHGGVVDWLGPAWAGPVVFPAATNIADLALLSAAALIVAGWWAAQRARRAA